MKSENKSNRTAEEPQLNESRKNKSANDSKSRKNKLSKSRKNKSAKDSKLNDSSRYNSANDSKLNESSRYNSANDSKLNESSRYKTARESQLHDTSSFENRPPLATSSRTDTSRTSQNLKLCHGKCKTKTGGDFACFPDADGEDSIIHPSPQRTSFRTPSKEKSKEKKKKNKEKTKKGKDKDVDNAYEESLRCYCGGKPDSSQCRVNMVTDRAQEQHEKCLNCLCPKGSPKK